MNQNTNPTRTESHSQSDSSAVAVVGMACRLPGAHDPDAFWSMILEGRDAIAPAPEDRLDRARYYDPTVGVRNKTYSDLAALVDYPAVDPSVFPFPDERIAASDPAHRLLCDVSARACLDAGLDQDALRRARGGVFVGHARASSRSSEMAYAAVLPQLADMLGRDPAFQKLARERGGPLLDELVRDAERKIPMRGSADAPMLGASAAPLLVSRVLGLDGPCMTFNSACASSLHAVAQAVLALRMGYLDLAVVGGVSFFHVDTLVLFSQARSLTARRSCPFDAEADGLVVGEGAVSLVLKRLDRAVADGDAIHAVISSIGVASDGKGRSLWAPRKEGQLEAMRRAYPDNAQKHRVGYVEAHATSTALGDATEVEAIAEFFGNGDPTRDPLPLGSAKGNIGHALEVAGIAGLLKAILCLRHRTIPPVAGLRRLNPNIPWETIPVRAPLRAEPWNARGDAPRRAAVNAFGIGGLNVHIVVDEYDARSTSTTPRRSPEKVPAHEGNGKGDAGVSFDAGCQPIAILGMGAVLPGALNVEAYWDLLASRSAAIASPPVARWSLEAQRRGVEFADAARAPRGAFIDDFQYDWRRHKIPPKQIAQANPLQFMILDAVEQAFHAARLDPASIDRTRVGVVVGTSFGGEFASQLTMGLRLPELRADLARRMLALGLPRQEIEPVLDAFVETVLRHMPALLDETGSFTASALASRITKSFDLMGGAVAVDAGHASSMAALQCCVDQLRDGANDLMICIAGHRDMGPSLFEGMKGAGTLAEQEGVAPLDEDARGCSPGEGCGVLLLSRLEDARRSGRRAFATIRRLGCASGAKPRETAKKAIRNADPLGNGALAAFQEIIPLGLPEIDAAVVDALAAARRDPDGKARLLGSVVGQIGHLGAASGMASLIKAAIALSLEKMPATVNVAQAASFLRRYHHVLQLQEHECTFSDLRRSPSEAIAVGVTSGDSVLYHVVLEESPDSRLPGKKD